MAAQPGGIGGPKSRSLLARVPDFARDVRIARALGLTSEQFYDLSDEERSIQIAEWEAAQAVCQQCGNPIEKCSDPAVTWFPQRIVCFATMERAAAQWRWEKLHEQRKWHDGQFKRWAKDRSKRTPYGRNDGVTITVTDTDYGLGGDFLGSDTT